MKMTNAIIAMTVLLLAGCAAGSDSWVNAQMGSGGNIAVDEIDTAKGLYRVSVMNAIDLGWNGDIPADRLGAAKVAMNRICQGASLVSETKIPLGSYAFGSRERNKYAMTMRCRNSDGLSQ